MQTTKDRGTAEPSADRRPPDRDRWRETWPALAALASALPAATILAAGCAADAECQHLLPPGIVDDGSGP